MLNIGFSDRWKGDQLFLKVIQQLDLSEEKKPVRDLYARMFRIPFECTEKNWSQYEKWETNQEEKAKMTIVYEKTKSYLDKINAFYEQLKLKLEEKNPELFV